ncbi:hypothetical protein GW916_15695 [bacterium]|nr:hypothetical protein [bacterium]
MSQVDLGVSSSPSVATSYVTDSGTATPAANILNVLGDDTTEYNANGITTLGVGDTVTILLTNRLQGTGSTSGAVTDDIVTFSLGATPGTFRVFGNAAAFNASTPASAGYRIEATTRTDGVTATLVGSLVAPQEDADLAAASLDAVVSGNNLIIRATGVAGLSINWSTSATYERVL